MTYCLVLSFTCVRQLDSDILKRATYSSHLHPQTFERGVPTLLKFSPPLCFLVSLDTQITRFSSDRCRLPATDTRFYRLFRCRHNFRAPWSPKSPKVLIRSTLSLTQRFLLSRVHPNSSFSLVDQFFNFHLQENL